MRHAGERQKNLHNHPFTWNNKQTIHFQACKERQEVCQHLSRLFSPSGALISFKPHRLAQVLQDASGQCGCENAICSHTITSTLAAVHTRPCLFISAWQRILMLIDFPKASPNAETWTLCSYLYTPAGSLLLKLRESSPN